MLRTAAAFAVLLLAVPGVARAADRYASPDGPTTTGSPCTQSTPCAIGLAARDAAPGDTVILTPGEYGSQTTPLGYGIYSAADGVTYVGGPQVRLFIDNADPDSVLLKAGQLWAGEGMTIVSFDPGGFHVQGDATVERLKVESRAPQNGAIACNLEGSTIASGTQGQIRNSVCSAFGGGTAVRALSAQARLNGQEFRAVSTTATASGPAGAAVWMGNSAIGLAPFASTLRLDLVLAASQGGGSYDIQAAADGIDQRACIAAYDSRADTGKISTGFCNIAETNATRGLPTFVGFGVDHHQRPGSAGIDPLVAAPTLPPLPADFDGLPRDSANPDPGAYEYREAIVTTLAPTDVTTTTATLRGSFRGRWGRSIVRFSHGPGVAPNAVTPARVVDATASAQPFSEQLTGLTPDTQYVVRLVSAQADESDANGELVTFRTAAPPAPPAATPTPSPGPGTVPGPGAGPTTGIAPTPAPTATTAKRCVVPRLKGLTLATARKRLARANCTLGRVKGKRSVRARVSTQTVKAGRRVKAGTRVGLTLKAKRARPKAR